MILRLTESSIFYVIFLCQWMEYLWKLYLSIRQYKVIIKTEIIPQTLTNFMSKETFTKSRLYAIDKEKFGFIKDTFLINISSITIYYGLLGKIWDFAETLNFYHGEIYISCIWILIVTTLQTIIDLPFTIYYNFVLEEKFGFNKQTAIFFIIDKTKSYIFRLVFFLPIVSITIVILQYEVHYLFIWLCVAVEILIIIFFSIIYPSYIAPLFDKYTPLPEGELKTRIEALAKQLKFPLNQIYVVEGSKRSSHCNAYSDGLLNSKQIVLFDTLLANPECGGCDNEEILAILSHEFGHWRHGHITKKLILKEFNLYLMYLMYQKCFRYSFIYKAVGFKTSRPVLVGTSASLILLMAPVNAIFSFFLACLSRKFELQVDKFVVQLGKTDSLRKAS